MDFRMGRHCWMVMQRPKEAEVIFVAGQSAVPIQVQNDR